MTIRTLDATSDDKLPARLIAAIGKSDVGEAERDWFVHWFRLLKRDALNQLPGLETKAELRELLRKYLSNAEEKRKLREQLTPFRYTLAKFRLNKLKDIPLPNDDSRRIPRMLIDSGLLARAEWAGEKDYQNFLEVADDYRKSPVRRCVLEPFLVMLQNEDVIPTHERPLSRMVDALLNWLGLDPRRYPRPTKSGLRTIASEVKRDFEKRPAQRPRR